MRLQGQGPNVVLAEPLVFDGVGRRSSVPFATILGNPLQGVAGRALRVD